jgi:hypothetical protein
MKDTIAAVILYMMIYLDARLNPYLSWEHFILGAVLALPVLIVLHYGVKKIQI